jgi:hypothetical protein
MAMSVGIQEMSKATQENQSEATGTAISVEPMYRGLSTESYPSRPVEGLKMQRRIAVIGGVNR